jgi:hypothetical protein
MKKAIVLLLALTVIGGAVFAQATVSGYVRARALYTESGLAYVDRLRLNFNYATEDKNVVAFARLQSSDQLAPTVAYLQGQVTALDGMLKVTGGKLAVYDYSIGSSGTDWLNGGVSNDGYHLDSVNGMLVQVFPVEGLNLGVHVLPAGTLDLADLGFNVKYDIADVGSVVVESDMGVDFAASRYSASFKFTGMEGLSAAVGYRHATDDTTSVYGVIGYKAGPAYMEVSPVFDLSASSIFAEAFLKYTASDSFALAVLGYYKSAPAVGSNGLLVGTEIYYTVSKKGLLQTGLSYGDVTGVAVPLIVKVSF